MPDQNLMDWLLEPSDPGVRYLVLRDLLKKPADDDELVAARKTAHEHGPIAHVLNNMHSDGYWEKPGPGYGPKYRSTVWSLILLGQLGASAREDGRIATACTYLFDNALAAGGQFSSMSSGAPSGTIDCLQGNLLRALMDLGCEDPRLEAAYEWMARSVTGEGVAVKEDRDAPLRYFAYKCGPDFRCGANFGYPCAWGAVKVMMAFAALPTERRSPLIDRAIGRGLDFLFSEELTSAAWPGHRYVNPEFKPMNAWTDNLPGTENYKPSSNWWKFGFPVYYNTDLLQVAEALTELGHGSDPRVTPLLDYIRGKADKSGRWLLEYDYTGKTWGNYGEKRQPNKWVTLRALRVLNW